jgi:ketosteroid isomerase-like protein
MIEKGIRFCAWVLVLCAIVAAVPALAAEPSDLAGRIVIWENEYNASNFKGVTAMYTADACRMPPNELTAHGADGVLAQLQSGKEKGIAKVKLGLTTAESSGDLGYGTGTYEIIDADGKTVDHGKWMNVSKKAKGKWLIQCDIWNSDVPLPAAEEKED